MFRFWFVFSTVAIAAIIGNGLLPADDLFRFVSPDEGAPLAGPTDIIFEVPSRNPTIDLIDIYLEGRYIGSASPPDWTFSWDAPVEESGKTLVAIAYTGETKVGQSSRRTTPINFHQDIKVSVVQLYPVVVNWRGKYVKDLVKEDFLVFDQGKQVEIEYFATEAAALNLFMMLDVSKSMTNKLYLVQHASCAFVDQLDPLDEVAVFSFNHTISEVTPLTDNHDMARAGIRSLSASGGTALYNSLIRVMHRMNETGGRKALVLFSDGIDEISLISLEQVIQDARKSDAIIYAIGAGQDEKSLEARKDLKILAEETGGDVHFIKSVKDLPDVFDSILLHLRAQYVISYSTPPGPKGVRTLDVRTVNSKYRVKCRQSYEH